MDFNWLLLLGCFTISTASWVLCNFSCSDHRSPLSHQEWVLAFKIALSDKLYIRIPERPVIWPPPLEVWSLSKISVGSAIDVWWNDGWWEGIVIQIDDTATNARVYFSGENEESFFQMKSPRVSQDWLNNQWIAPKLAPKIAASFNSLDN